MCVHRVTVFFYHCHFHHCDAWNSHDFDKYVHGLFTAGIPIYALLVAAEIGLYRCGIDTQNK